MARHIVLATANAAKRAQLCWLLAGAPLEPREAPPLDVPETAPDLAGNAALKALAYSAAGLAIASDGGLELLGLPPEPGRRMPPAPGGRLPPEPSRLPPEPGGR